MATKSAPQAKLHPKLARFQKAMSERTGVNMEEVMVTPSLKMEHINTGSTVLNLLIGGSRLPDGSFLCPGWPRGKIVEVYGRESSGKSTIALMAAGQAVASDNGQGTVLYVDLEHAVVDAYAMKLGVDFRPVELGGPGNAMRVCPHTFEETESIVMAACLNGVDLVVIDSVAGLVSRRDAQRNVANEKEKQGVAEVPRLMSAWMPKLQAVIFRTKTCVMFTNQTRDKIGAMGYTEEALKSTTGGNALKFWAALRLMLKPKQSAKARVYNPLLKDFEDVPVATDVEVKNIKNKIDAKQGHSGLITLRYGVGIDELRTMMNVAEAYKIVAHSKNSKKQDCYSYSSPTTGVVIEAVGIEKFRMALQRNRECLDEMLGLCSDRIIQGFRAIDDEQLAQLAEDAVMKKTEQSDDYEDDDDGPEVVSPEDMGIEDKVDVPTVDADELQ